MNISMVYLAEFQKKKKERNSQNRFFSSIKLVHKSGTKKLN